MDMAVITLLLILAGSLLTVDTEAAFLDTYNQEIDALSSKLNEKGVPTEWFYDNLKRESFRFYENMASFFNNMAEHRVSRGEISVSDYKQHFGVDLKVRRGIAFIQEHRELLQQVQNRNGIDYEIVVAILGMETNFAEQRQRGSFNVFDSLVSQYVLLPNRQRYAVNQLAALYEYSNRINRDVDYFVGSFAGASGWGQFIPASLVAFFISADGIDENTDIFSIEDTLFSIENYLAAHNLNRNTINSETHRRNAVFSYNRSDAYVQAVLHIYEELKKHREP